MIVIDQMDLENIFKHWECAFTISLLCPLKNLACRLREFQFPKSEYTMCQMWLKLIVEIKVDSALLLFLYYLENDVSLQLITYLTCGCQLLVFFLVLYFSVFITYTLLMYTLKWQNTTVLVFFLYRNVRKGIIIITEC